jgi:hypothetical protein
MTYPETPTQRYLASLGACKPAREWVADRTLTECWEQCERLDWLRWLVEAELLAAYRRATAEARSAYDRAIAELLAAYRRAAAEARSAYDRAIAEPRAAYDRDTAEPRSAYARDTAAPRAAYDRDTAEPLAAYCRAMAEVSACSACSSCDDLRAKFPCPEVPA